MNKLKVHFILEGFEENALFQIIDELSNINMIEMSYKNCKGGGKVSFYYQDAYASGNYDIIYCVYDVDFKSTDNSGMYYRIRKGLYEILGDEAEVNNVSLCTNPNTLLILLLGYDDIENLKSIKADKKSNTALIKKYCPKIGGKKEYDASEWQLKLIQDDYIYSKKASLENIILNIDKVDNNYSKKHVATNIIPVIKALIEDDLKYFKS